jgi:hypothetical protein
MSKFNVIDFAKSQFGWLKGSADNEPGGASSKKLTGFFCILMTGLLCLVWVIWAFLKDNFDLLIPVLTILVGAGLGALGINSNEKIKMKDKINGDGSEDQSKGMG